MIRATFIPYIVRIRISFFNFRDSDRKVVTKINVRVIHWLKNCRALM
jgi:hypothetical protein